MWLGLRSLNGTNCNPASNNTGGSGAIGDLLRFPPSETDAVTGKLLTQEYTNGVTIGDYYYGYQSYLHDTTCSPINTVQLADSAFAAAAKSMVSD
jgi:hypothetical protein